MRPLGFVGLGQMGARMATRLVDAGPALWVVDADPGRAASLTARGAHRAATPADLARTCGSVFLSLPDSAAVEAVVAAMLPHAGPHLCVVDLSTASPESSRRLAAALAERGATWLDAPVSGGTRGAEAGTLTLMVGGDAAVLDAQRPLLARLGERIVHVGPAGTGHAIKLINNFLLAAALAASAEAMALAAASGLAPEQALAVINASSGRSWATEQKWPAVLAGQTTPTFTLGLMAKDLGLYLEAARKRQHPTPLGDLVGILLQQAVESAGSQVDYTEVARRAVDR